MKMKARHDETIQEDFNGFMQTLEALNELHKLSCDTVAAFKQNLESYRMHKVSTAAKNLESSAAASKRLSRYLEAGGWLEDAAQSLAFKIDSAIKKLHQYLHQAQVYYNTLSQTYETVTRDDEICTDALNLPLSPLDEVEVIRKLESLDISSPPSSGDELDVVQSGSEGHSGLSYSDCAPVMALIVKMTEQELEMWTKIVGALGLDTPSPSLETYTLMWTLRPFFDDQIIEHAWRLVKT